MTADCVGGIAILPKGEIMYKNSNIVITASFISIELWTGLKEKYTFFLKSEGEKVELEKTDFELKNSRQLILILKPVKELKSNINYELRVEGLPKNFERYLYNQYSEGKMIRKNWFIFDDYDTNPPLILKNPEIIDQENIAYGCGTSALTNFEVFAEDCENSEVFILAEIVEIKTGKSSSFFTRIFDDTFFAGKNMCGGPFLYDKGNYKIRFKFFDICGNTTDNWTNWIYHKSPISC